MVSTYSLDEHTIIDGELSRYITRLTEGDPLRRNHLFVVRYNKLGVFVIAEWLAKPRDIFIDVLNLGSSLQSFTRKKANELKTRLFAPLTAEGTNQQVAQAESDYHHGLQDENEEETERWERLARGE